MDSIQKESLFLSESRKFTIRIVNTHKTSVLKEEKMAEIDKILEEARIFYKKKGLL